MQTLGRSDIIVPEWSVGEWTNALLVCVLYLLMELLATVADSAQASEKAIMNRLDAIHRSVWARRYLR